jgi:hypothetical protein
MKHLALLLIVAGLTGCGIISKQYYYVPSVAHKATKTRNGYPDDKIVYSSVKVTNKTGDSIGTITTDHGFGHPLLIGPFLPVIPIGGIFNKQTSRFSMELDVRCSKEYLMLMAIDSNDYKKGRDSLNAVKIRKVAPLKSSNCYIIANGTKKIPLFTDAFFFDKKSTGYNYTLTADIKFTKIKTMKLVTGNALLDSTLKNITYKRKGKIVFNLLAP